MAKRRSKIKYEMLPRDISWMYFNHRILQEARREDVPILERMSFLGIYSNNLDEFFRVRVANLSRIASIDTRGKKDVKDAVIDAKEQIKIINKLNSAFAKEYTQAIDEVTSALNKAGIVVIDHNQISEEQKEFVRKFFTQRLLGRIMPVWFENLNHFDKDNDDDIYMIARLKHSEQKSRYAIFHLPVNTVGRWIKLPDTTCVDENENTTTKKTIMYLDDVVRVCLPLIFPGEKCEDFDAWTFKFTRDAEMEFENDLRIGLLQRVQKGVKSRMIGTPIRMVYDENMPKSVLHRIKVLLKGNDHLVTIVPSQKYQNHRDLMSFPDCGIEGLHYEPCVPIRQSDLLESDSIIATIRLKDRMMHVPYHSFDAYIRLLNEAAINPKVKTIKTTLYRLAKDSKVINALICAAQNGKKVTAVIELLARFDEASNITWSKKMQAAGIRYFLV